jgi:cysteine desulfurase family protein
MIYLDNAATSFPKPAAVINAVADCMRATGANPGRGQHEMALGAARAVLKTRQAVARLLGVADPLNIIFTANATEALNLAIKGWVRPGDTVVTTSIEHNSVYRPLIRLSEKAGVRIRTVPSGPDGRFDMKELEKSVTAGVRLVVASHASNVIGNILPLDDIVTVTKRAKVPLLVDAAQTAGLVPLDIKSLGVEMVAFTGHKAVLGPQGTGGLYLSPDLEIEELKQGGTGSGSKHQPLFRPDRYECGTINGPGLAGLRVAVELKTKEDLAAVFERENRQMEKLMVGLEKIEGVTIYGPPLGTNRVSLVSMQMAGLSPHQVAALLDRRFQIAARAGFHCAPEAHKILGTFDTGTLRLSPGHLTADDDIDRTIEALTEIRKMGRQGIRG